MNNLWSDHNNLYFHANLSMKKICFYIFQCAPKCLACERANCQPIQWSMLVRSQVVSLQPIISGISNRGKQEKDGEENEDVPVVLPVSMAIEFHLPSPCNLTCSVRSLSSSAVHGPFLQPSTSGWAPHPPPPMLLTQDIWKIREKTRKNQSTYCFKFFFSHSFALPFFLGGYLSNFLNSIAAWVGSVHIYRCTKEVHLEKITLFVCHVQVISISNCSRYGGSPT